MNVFLIGPMGAGKSTIGRLLSQSLGLEFHDSDREIEARAGTNIPWIFDVEGEEGFRQREEGVIDELTRLEGIVLATGGGAVLRESNRRHLQSGGRWSTCKPRSNSSWHGPRKIATVRCCRRKNPRVVLEQLIAQRDPLYRDCCDLMIRTDRRHPRGVVNDIIRFLKRQQPLKKI